MKKILGLLAIAGFISCNDRSEIRVDQVPMEWRYDVPATKYWEGLPIGTGRFGAMIPGAVGREVIAFNDETLWTGGPYNPNNPKGPAILAKARERAFAHDWVGATDEAWKLSGIPEHVQFYQAMGRLNLQYEGQEFERTTGYSRTLDMENALVDVRYRLDDVNYSRRIFASYPDQVIVIRLTADQKGKINLSGRFTSLQSSAVARAENNEIIMDGSTISEKENEVILPPKMKWQSRVRIIPEGGTLSTEGDRLVLTGADAATLILAGATNWTAWNDVSGDAAKRCTDYVSNASKHSYDELLKRHLDDYRPLFNACRINLGADPDPLATTTRSMEAIRTGVINPAYEARYFQYGRYLMLAGAREKTLAFNNHNIWLDDLEGRWRGRWTLNINIQECYWPVESTNLPVVNESLLYFVEQLAQAGARTAKELYGCRGWCAHHGTDIWFNTAPTDGHPQHATYPMTGLWLMQQLYDHYLYHPDVQYLQRIYPLMKGAAEFVHDFLVKDPKSGYMVTCPASSPENSFLDEKGNRASISYGSAGDMQIVRNSLRNFVQASRALNCDPELNARSAALLEQLPPHRIGRFGQLQEWFFDFRESEVTHRHISHLWAAYPDDDITLRKTPELAEAVRVTLKRRGDINMGWSGAWKINQHARLEEPQEAYAILHKMLTDVSIHPQEEDSQVTPSFEGNQAIQGVTAGMAEMLMQSHSSELSLLPALPAQWPTGEIAGLRARGGYDVSLAWRNGQLSAADVTARLDNTCRLRTRIPVNVLSGGKEIPVKRLDDGLIEFEVKAGERFRITPK